MKDQIAGLTGAPPTHGAWWSRIVAAMSAVAIGVTSLLAFAPVAQAASGLPALPLSTDGSDIVDANGDTVVLQGVNWFGFETANHAPHGLWSRDYREMLRQIKVQGFNTIRIPFSLEALESSTTSGIDFGGGRNAALQGKTPQQVMDIIIDEAGAQGLMVILDNHSLADDGFMYPLWYGQDGYTETDWVNAWKKLAERYDGEPQVIAADLKNEPHGQATWGTGGATDWRRAAEVAGNAVLAQNPDLLILVEGIEAPVAGGKLDRHWWGGNLEGVRTHPVRLTEPNKLVYSPHEYGPGVFAQPWFSDPNMASILQRRWDAGFGYIEEQAIAPLLVGEFGAKNVGLDTVEGRWIRQFADYLGSRGISWTFWSWNPNSGDTGGVLKDDWTTVHADKMDLLTDLMDRQPMEFGGVVRRTPIDTEPIDADSVDDGDASPVLDGVLSMSVVTDSTWDGGWCGHVVVRNDGGSAAQLTSISLRLGSGQTVSSVWNGDASLTGSTLTIAVPSWGRAPAGGTFTDTGMCLTGSGTPTALGVKSDGVDTVAPALAPESEPSRESTSASMPGGGASDSSLTAAFADDSTWASGYCRSVVIINGGAEASAPWTLSFRLPTSTTMTASWNGSVVQSGDVVTVTPPAWAESISAGGISAMFGFCANGSDQPSDPKVSVA